MSRASGFIPRQVDVGRRVWIWTAGGLAPEAPRHIAILSGTLPRGRARGHLYRTIGLLPSILFLQLLTMCWRVTAGSMKAGYAGLPSPETLPEEISRWYLPRASAPNWCPPRLLSLERLQCRRSLIFRSQAHRTTPCRQTV